MSYITDMNGEIGDLQAENVELKEALARVEAERDAERARGDAAVGDANEAEAQLAEAVGLLRDSLSTIDTLPGYPCGVEIANRIESFLARHAQAAHGNDAVRVIELLATCEWKLIKAIPADYLTDESNTKNAWWVERQQAPYCAESGERVWTGATAIEAFEKAIAAMRAQADK